MENGQLRVALFGAGKMGAHHARAIQAHGKARLVAIYDPLLEQSGAALLSPHAKAYADPELLFREAKPDVVHICTPPASHVPLTRLALEHGASVYVEKPVTDTGAEARTLLALAASKGLQVCAGHQYLFESPAVRMRESLARIGRVVHVESYFSFRKVRKNLSFVEQAIDILPHPTYLLVDVLRQATSGEPILVEGVQASVDGEARALVRSGQTTGALIVSLQGRPVDHYLKVTGTNGCLIADFVRGSFTMLDGPGAGFLPLVTIPFDQAKQMRRGARQGLWKRVAGGGASYPGLTTLIRTFHESLLAGAASPTDADGIQETVDLCELVAGKLRETARAKQAVDEQTLRAAEATLPPTRSGKGKVLVTGATGFLGRRVVRELRTAGWPVQAVGRSLPAFADREPGVTYVACDLGSAVPASVLAGVHTVVHCAASSDGGKGAHERGTIAATRNIVDAAAAAGIRRFVHISSLAVLVPGSSPSKPASETTTVDRGNLNRGPYVWAKAEAESIVGDAVAAGKIDARVIRPGPIVNFLEFDPPGRLGRDLGSHYVAVGSQSSPISVVDVGTVARVILEFVERFDEAPKLVNLVEPDAPTRRDLVRRAVDARPWLRPVWFPGWLMAIGSPVAVVAQRVLLKSPLPINLAAAFASEYYDTSVARRLLSSIEQRSLQDR